MRHKVEKEIKSNSLKSKIGKKYKDREKREFRKRIKNDLIVIYGEKERREERESILSSVTLRDEFCSLPKCSVKSLV